MLTTQGADTHGHAEAHELKTHIHNSVLFMSEVIGRRGGTNNTQRQNSNHLFTHTNKKYIFNISLDPFQMASATLFSFESHPLGVI